MTDLRAALEAAYDEQESVGNDEPTSSSEEGGPEAHAEESVRDTTPTERSEPGEGQEPQTSDKAGELKKEAETQEKTQEQTQQSTQPRETKPAERPPESWRPATREHWAKLPAEVRQEVMKREQEVAHFVQQTAAKRKIADAFVNVANQFSPLIQASGMNPVEAYQQALQYQAVLANGTAPAKAKLIADLVKNFSVNIRDLDAALSGEDLPDDPNDKIAQLLDQRLAPVNQFMQQIGQMRQQRVQQTDQQMDQEISAFANDPKHEFFKDVHLEMADIIEMGARRGISISMEDAYERACKLSPEVQKVLSARVAAKKQAASSVRSRGPSTAQSSETASMREDLERAFDSVANR